LTHEGFPGKLNKLAGSSETPFITKFLKTERVESDIAKVWLYYVRLGSVGRP